jgi:hypothetical protein
MSARAPLTAVSRCSSRARQVGVRGRGEQDDARDDARLREGGAARRRLHRRDDAAGGAVLGSAQVDAQATSLRIDVACAGAVDVVVAAGGME